MPSGLGRKQIYLQFLNYSYYKLNSWISFSKWKKDDCDWKESPENKFVLHVT